MAVTGTVADRPGTWLLKAGTDQVRMISESRFDWMTTDEGTLFGLASEGSPITGAGVTLQEFRLSRISGWSSCKSAG